MLPSQLAKLAAAWLLACVLSWAAGCAHTRATCSPAGRPIIEATTYFRIVEVEATCYTPEGERAGTVRTQHEPGSAGLWEFLAGVVSTAAAAFAL